MESASELRLGLSELPDGITGNFVPGGCEMSQEKKEAQTSGFNRKCEYKHNRVFSFAIQMQGHVVCS